VKDDPVPEPVSSRVNSVRDHARRALEAGLNQHSGDPSSGARARRPRRNPPLPAVLPDSLIMDAVTAHAASIQEATAFIHAHPELAFEEHQCAEYLAAVLEQAGFAVERAVAGMPTAFRATIAGARSGQTVGLIAVYDAVPTVQRDGTITPVHSCGHGPQAAGVVGAALALGELNDRLAGSITVLGLPADETTAPAAAVRGGGKEISVHAGLWKSIDAALYAHPEFIDAVLLHSLWMRQDQAAVLGRMSLEDRSAQQMLDIVGAALQRVRAEPPQRLVLERAAFSGNVRDGCQLALEFRVSAADERGLRELAQRLSAELPHSAWRERRMVPSVRADESVRAAVASAMAAAGREFATAPPMLPHATDFGFVSRAVPAALIGLSRPGGWALHADEGADLFAGADGDAVAVAIAQVLALATARLTEPS
jgi:metal-dependent amidase/aminoacylase/carboxypeptidase family protein